MTANPIHSSTIRIGEKLDKFEIVAQIGAGGMSVVWKGYDRLLDRFVAIKQLLLPSTAETVNSGGDEDAFRERFRREAKIQKQIAGGHKHLMRIIDFLDEPRGLFIVMEFIDGPSLEQLLAQYPEPMEERRVLGIVGAAALGLEAIHKAGALHRDLKPSNLLLPKQGGLKVSDFGLAALTAEQDALSLGSVRYMAPELFREEKADGRADLYSLGMIAYEMLAGRKAFEEAFKVVLRDQRNQALRWMKWHTNPRAKAPPLSQINPKISPTLSDLIARLMAKDLEGRIGTAHELLDAIRRHFAADASDTSLQTVEAPASVPAVGSANPTAPLPRKSRWPYILAAVVAIELVAMAGFWAWHQRGQREVVEQTRREARAKFNEATNDYSHQKFAEARDKFEALATAWPKDSDLGKSSKAWATLSQARVDFEAGRYDEARALFEQADKSGVFDTKRDTIGAYRNQALNKAAFEQLCARIEAQITAGKYAEARQLIADARRTGATPEETEKLDVLAVRNEDQAMRGKVVEVLNRAKEMASGDRRDQAIDYLIQAKRRYRSTDLDQLLDQYQKDKSYDQAITDAQAAEKSGNSGAAIAAYGHALAIKPDTAIEEKIAVIKSRAALDEGRKLLAQGSTGQAREAFTRSLGYHDNPDAQTELNKMKSADQRAGFVQAGDSAMAEKEFDAAIKQYENALKLAADDAVSGKLAAAHTRFDVQRAKTLIGQAKLDDARALLKNVLASQSTDKEAKQLLADLERRGDYEKQLALGDSLARQSRFDDAKRAYLHAKAILSTTDVQDRIDGTEYNQLIARVQLYISAENWTSAHALLRTATQLRGPTEETKRLLAEIQKHEKAGDDKGKD